MRKITKDVLTLLILGITLIYGIGDYFSWWDDLSGRTLAIKGWNILANNKITMQEILIKSHESEFKQLEKIILTMQMFQLYLL
jgi:hypothetical protein